MLVAVLVTSKVAFAAADAAGPLKLQQRGVPKVPPDNFLSNYF